MRPSFPGIRRNTPKKQILIHPNQPRLVKGDPANKLIGKKSSLANRVPVKVVRQLPLWLIETLPGLMPWTRREVNRFTRRSGRFYQIDEERSDIYIEFGGDISSLAQFKTATSISRVIRFDVPRPKALLGEVHFLAILKAIESILSTAGRRNFKSFRIDAAGSDSSLFQRLIQDLAQRTRLPCDQDDGDLLLRVRPSRIHKNEWEVLIRISPRPLSVRSWRKVNYPGAANACVAAAMIDECRQSTTAATDTPAKIAAKKSSTRQRASLPPNILNLGCGSGTFLIERLLSDPKVGLAIGIDIDSEVVESARANISAAKIKGIKLIKADLTDIDVTIGAHKFDEIYCDLPWGERIGNRRDNPRLYGSILRVATNYSEPGAKMALLTQDTDSIVPVLEKFTSEWQILCSSRVLQGGYTPTFYILERQ